MTSFDYINFFSPSVGQWQQPENFVTPDQMTAAAKADTSAASGGLTVFARSSPVLLRSFGPDITGAVDTGPMWRAALAALEARGGGVLDARINGTLLVNIYDDASILRIPSGVEILGIARATKIKSDHTVTVPGTAPYRPVFVAYDKKGFRLSGIDFINSGNFIGASGSGTLGLLGTGNMYPWYNYSSNIFLHRGSDFVVENIRSFGVTRANVLNTCIYFNGNTRSEISNIYAEDSACTLLSGNAEYMKIDNIGGDYLNSDEAIVAYGPGHVAYLFVGKGCSITNLYDGGNDSGSNNTGHTLSLKESTNVTVKGIISSRGVGPLNFQNVSNCNFSDVSWKDNGVGEHIVAAVYAVTSGTQKDCVLSNINLSTTRDIMLLGGNFGAGSKVTAILRKDADANTKPVTLLEGSKTSYDLKISQEGSAISKLVQNNSSTFRNNMIRIDVNQEAPPTVNMVSPSSQVGGAYSVWDLTIRPSLATGRMQPLAFPTEFFGTSDNTLHKTSSMTVNGTWPIYEKQLSTPSTSVNETLQLPGFGTYFCNVQISSGDRNHGRQALLKVGFYDGTYDLNYVERIGSEQTWGQGATKYQELGVGNVSVTASGLLAVINTMSTSDQAFVQVSINKIGAIG